MTELATHTKGLEVAGFAGVELCGVQNQPTYCMQARELLSGVVRLAAS